MSPKDTTQKMQVVEAMRRNGGYATLQQLNRLVDVSKWKSKTPFASIRRIVQIDPKVFFKIRPGLWALKEKEQEVLQRFAIESGNKLSEDVFTHGYFQGIIVQLGNMRNYGTFVPAQDKNRLFLETKLIDLTTTKEIPRFTYDNLLNKAKTVDVIWFNERQMPCRFYEVEHSTDIRNSLDKFFELQDFRATYYIIADQTRERQYQSILNNSLYKPVREYIKFFSYDKLIKQYESEINITERI